MLLRKLFSQPLILLGTLLMFPLIINAQLQVSNWYFGNKAGLNFNVADGAMPTVLFDGQLRTIEGCATISDENGNLLFYTDGIRVYNSLHTQMNTTLLHGDPSSSQSGIIVPNPANNGIYYIFTVDANDNYPNNDDDIDSGGPLKGFKFSTVDMNLNGGLGAVTNYNTPLPLELGNPNLCSEKVTAVRHFDQHDVWVITHLRNKFYSFRVTDSGVNTTPVTTTIAPNITPDGFVVNARGYMKASPNGKYVAIAHYSNMTSGFSSNNNTTPNNAKSGILALYNFDNQTGTLNTYRELDNQGTPYGVEFSPNSEFLYAEIDYNNQSTYEWTGGRLVQWKLEDLSSIDIVNINSGSSNWPLVSGSTRMRGALQLGIDGRIYYSKTQIFLDNFDTNDIRTAYRGPTLSVIHQPNLEGLACDFQVNSYSVTNPPGFNPANDTFGTNHYVAYGLPPFITSYFNNNVEIDVEEVCEEEEANFTLVIDNSVQGITQIVWNMGDGTQYFDAEEITHVYQDPGTYVIEVELHIGTDGLIIPVSYELEVYPKPEIQNATLIQCDDLILDGIANFDLTMAEAEMIVNGNTADYTFEYYLSEDDAHNQNNPQPTDFTNTTNPQTLYVRIANEYLCYRIAELELEVNPDRFMLELDPVCDDESNDEVEFWNLNDLFDAEVLALYPNSQVHYYLSDEDAYNDENRLTNTSNFENTSNPQIIYIRSNDGINCNAIGQVTLTILESPELEIEDVAVCSDTEVTFDAGPGFDSYEWSNGSDLQSITISEPGEYWVTVSLANGCETTENFELSNPWQRPEAQNTILVQCEDAIIDGITNFDLSWAEPEILINANGNQIDFSYYHSFDDAENENNPIAENYTNATNPELIFVRVENEHGCYTIVELELQVHHEEFDLGTYEVCDDESNDEIAVWDLPNLFDNQLLIDYAATSVAYYETIEDAQQDINRIPNASNFTNNTNPQTIYIRVLNGASCAALGQVELLLKESPQLDPQTVKVCPEEFYTFDAGSGFVSYLWSNGSTEQTITVNEPGIYTITVSNGACETSENMELINVQPLITDIIIDGINAQIIAVGEEPLEYSLDLENWQSSNEFTSLPFGNFAAYVRDAFGCISEARLFSIIAVPNIITPNGDGKNDAWNLKGLDLYPDATVDIYDRYGKLLKHYVVPDLYGDIEVPITDILNDPTPFYVWDGTYLGRPVPSTSYWYIIQLPDGRKFSGYLVVKNRNSIY